MTTPPQTQPRRTARADRGSVSVELALLSPVLVAIMLLAVAFGRVVSVQLDIDAAAHAAARAASLARSLAAAEADANHAAQSTIDGRTSCQDLTISIDTAGLEPGGAVTVTVACTVPLGDLTLTGIGGSRTITSTATAPIDSWRAAP